jgi:hypothetical protein
MTQAGKAQAATATKFWCSQPDATPSARDRGAPRAFRVPAPGRHVPAVPKVPRSLEANVTFAGQTRGLTAGYGSRPRVYGRTGARMRQLPATSVGAETTKNQRRSVHASRGVHARKLAVLPEVGAGFRAALPPVRAARCLRRPCSASPARCSPRATTNGKSATGASSPKHPRPSSTSPPRAASRTSTRLPGPARSRRSAGRDRSASCWRLNCSRRGTACWLSGKSRVACDGIDLAGWQ